MIKSKKALADIIGRTLTKLAQMGPPAPGTGDTGSGLFK